MTDPADDVLAALKATVSQASQSPLYADRLRDVQLESLDDFRSLPLTSRIDLTSQGIHGTRAVPIERVCHYGETSGTTGAPNSTWLTAHDFASNAKAIATRHPDVFAPGRILLNRFPFMAAPAHLMQLAPERNSSKPVSVEDICASGWLRNLRNRVDRDIPSVRESRVPR